MSNSVVLLASIDGAGYRNIVCVIDFLGDSAFRTWKQGKSSDWWHFGCNSNGHVGTYFWECQIPLVRSENIFTHHDSLLEGYSRLSQCMSGQIDTHEYAGSCIDRIRLSQRDNLQGSGCFSTHDIQRSDSPIGKVIEVTASENFAILRSGQNWEKCDTQHKKIYIDKLESVLKVGMEEIRDDMETGCLGNIFAQEIDSSGGKMSRSFSLSVWKSVSALVNWTSKSRSHRNITGNGMPLMKPGADLQDLRLWHEMSILGKCMARFRFFNCHDKTPVLKSVCASAGNTDG